MCLICRDLDNLSMTLVEAEVNLKEMASVPQSKAKAEHYRELQWAIEDMDLDRLDRAMTEGLREEPDFGSMYTER